MNVSAEGIRTEIFPAIDVIGGQVVRLLQGDFERKTVFGDLPAEQAALFAEKGAGYLHLVDLDGARLGQPGCFDTVERIVSETCLRVEIGGGIRTEETVEKYLEKGAFRVILGTVCVTDPEFTERMAKRYGDRIAAGLDARGGMVAIKGWKEVSQLSLDDAFKRLTDSGVSTVICTDISKDGAMAGINDAFYRDLVGRYTLKKGCGIVASGGVTDMDDVRRLASAGVSGIIIGRSLYDGRIRLEDALKAVRSEEK